jgi:hypothetical protein
MKALMVCVALSAIAPAAIAETYTLGGLSADTQFLILNSRIVRSKDSVEFWTLDVFKEPQHVNSDSFDYVLEHFTTDCKGHYNTTDYIEYSLPNGATVFYHYDIKGPSKIVIPQSVFEDVIAAVCRKTTAPTFNTDANLLAIATKTRELMQSRQQ